VNPTFHIHLISDSTGDTLNTMATAALAQFENVDVHIHPYALVRSEHQLTRALDHVAIQPGLVFFTLASEGLRDKLIRRCDAMLVDCVDVLEGPIAALRQFLGAAESHKVGRQHRVDQRYLERIDALEFTIQHDDGQSLASIDQAEVILTGASRTSKTPTCVYLAIRGIRAANVPLVAGMAPPDALLTARGPLIVGLWISPDRLIQVRRNRLAAMGQTHDSDYVDSDAVRAEIAATRRLFEVQDWPTIDISRRSIEETAAAVLNLLAERGAHTHTDAAGRDGGA
jgi:regulator of PEP synthase PpsR (kinase-PPPase family)